MFVKRAAMVCVTALFVGGCSVEALDEEDSEPVESVEQAYIWMCDGSDRWVRNWYSNFSKTVLTGREACNCDGTITMCGTKSNYYTQQGVGACPGPNLSCYPEDAVTGH